MNIWPIVRALLLGQARTLAAGVAGILITDGVLTSNQNDAFIGSVCFLITAGFSAFDKFVVNKKIKVAAATGVKPS